MCGICCICGHSSDTCADYIESQTRLSRRGPDINDSKQINIHEDKVLTLIGHVLHLRGQLTPQPLSDAEGNVLLWNGEIFGGIEVNEEENDTEILQKLLSWSSDASHIINIMAQIQGPWAFVYWQERTKCLWFGRDIFGRRSLLWHLPDSEHDRFILTSTRMPESDEYMEVPSVGLYCVTFPRSCDSEDCTLNIHLYPWHRAVWPGTMDKVNANTLNDRLYPNYSNSNVTFTLDLEQQVPSQIPVLNKEIPPGECNDSSKQNLDSQKYIQDLIKDDVNLNSLSDQLIHVLQMAVCKRVYNQPDLQQRDRMRKHQSDNGGYKSGNKESGDLKSEIDGKGKQSPDSQTLHKSPKLDNMDIGCSHLLTENQNSGTTNILAENSGNQTTSISDRKMSDYIASETNDVIRNSSNASDNDSANNIKDGHVTDLSGSEVKSSGSVISNSKDISQFDLSSKSFDEDKCNNVKSAKVAILFSGGIDSAVITALVDRCLPIEEPVDLLNVAFEQNNTKCDGKNGDQRWNVPDRQTGYSALSELNPNRKWNFVLVNVTLEELKKIRSDHVRHLVYPLDTVLDDSIGCAVWFAARGQGIMGNGENIGQPYTSKAKVILCGMGADEQLAGYARHRGKYQESGFYGLVEEIELEVSRISARNLGRDDRIITDHGKESRFPFLDENVVSFLSQLPIHHKANLDLPRGLGEKLLLRMSATKLGLVNTAVFPKRAIQFGSRIAKIENSKEKATDKCTRLTES